MGREVMAVPGPITSELSAAPHQLIRDGAALIRDPSDLLAELGFGTPDRGGVAPSSATFEPPEASPEELLVLKALAGATPPDLVAARLGLPLSAVMAHLLRLELRGVVRSAGGRYERALAPGKDAR